MRLVEGAYEDAQEAARALADSEGRPLIHPFADPDVVAGQGTVGLEIASDAPDTRLIVVPMGGGGLVSGIAIAAKERLDGVRVVAVQAAERSRRTIADGIAVKQPGELTRKLVDDYVDDVVAVSDDEIAQAMVHLIDRSKLVVEGAGAAAAAAVLCGRVEPPAERLGLRRALGRERGRIAARGVHPHGRDGGGPARCAEDGPARPARGARRAATRGG